jgi:biotin carboxyl carrier protein
MKARVNQNLEILLDNSEENQELMDLDMIPLGANNYHVLLNNQSFHCELLEINREEKKLLIQINERSYEVQLIDEYDDLLAELGMDAASRGGAEDLKAPMPGLVLSIDVEVGQEVQKGDALLILEAMKMENVLKASGPATIQSIEIEKGQAVEKNQVLIRMQ